MAAKHVRKIGIDGRLVCELLLVEVQHFRHSITGDDVALHECLANEEIGLALFPQQLRYLRIIQQAEFLGEFAKR